MEMIDIDRCTAVSTELAEWLAEEGARLLEERSDWTRSIAQGLRNASRPLLPVKVKAPATAPVAATAPSSTTSATLTLTLTWRGRPGQVCLLLVSSAACPSDCSHAPRPNNVDDSAPNNDPVADNDGVFSRLGRVGPQFRREPCFTSVWALP